MLKDEDRPHATQEELAADLGAAIHRVVQQLGPHAKIADDAEGPMPVVFAMLYMAANHALHGGASLKDFNNISSAAWKLSLSTPTH